MIQNILLRLLGLILLISGLALAGWIGYNICFATPEELTHASGSSARNNARVFSFGLVVALVGGGLLFGKWTSKTPTRSDASRL